jgi:hypothetical protein
MRYHSKAVARLIKFELSHLKPSWKVYNHSFSRSISCINIRHQTAETDMGKDKGKDKIQFQLKTPKGTKDCQCCNMIRMYYNFSDFSIGEGRDVVLRDKIFSTITSVFKRHGGVTIDT